MSVVSPSDFAYHIELRKQVLLECDAMARHAFASGREVPGQMAAVLEEVQRELAEDLPGEENETEDSAAQDLALLARLHAGLSRIVAPATPRTILLLARESARKGPLIFLGPVPLIRRMMIAAILFLISFICLGLFKEVNQTGGDILKSFGFPLLVNLLFFLSAAGLGASFAALFLANGYIKEGTFDPKFDASYWIRFILGLIAGLILALLVPDLEKMGRPTLAMLGGFSAAAVHRLLNRLVQMVETLVRGDNKEAMALREEAVRVQHAEAIQTLRLKVAGELMKLKETVANGKGAGDAVRKVELLLDELVPDESLNASRPVEPGRKKTAKTAKTTRANSAKKTRRGAAKKSRANTSGA